MSARLTLSNPCSRIVRNHHVRTCGWKQTCKSQDGIATKEPPHHKTALERFVEDRREWSARRISKRIAETPQSHSPGNIHGSIEEVGVCTVI